MSIFNKVKNLFNDEEEPIKSEVFQVEIPAPAPPKQPTKESKPLFFNDDDFKEFEKPKPKPMIAPQVTSSSYKKSPKQYKDDFSKKTEEKKSFKPTPIISPVYGVIDKNQKQETTVQGRKIEPITSTAILSIDDVRKKAFGTLEDDLELALFESNFSKDVIDSVEAPNTRDFQADDGDLLEDLMEDETIEIDEKESELFDLIDSMYENGGKYD